jgi:hypothetical protein
MAGDGGGRPDVRLTRVRYAKKKKPFSAAERSSDFPGGGPYTCKPQRNNDLFDPLVRGDRLHDVSGRWQRRINRRVNVYRHAQQCGSKTKRPKALSSRRGGNGKGSISYGTPVHTPIPMVSDPSLRRQGCKYQLEGR